MSVDNRWKCDGKGCGAATNPYTMSWWCIITYKGPIKKAEQHFCSDICLKNRRY